MSDLRHGRDDNLITCSGAIEWSTLSVTLLSPVMDAKTCPRADWKAFTPIFVVPSVARWCAMTVRF